jgi:hypothetical protein
VGGWHEHNQNILASKCQASCLGWVVPKES